MSNIMTEPDVSQSLPIAPYESDDTTPSSPEAEAVYDVKPAGDASDVLIDMPQTYSGPLRPGENSAEVLETIEISEEPTSFILQWSNQDQIDHRDRFAETGRLSKYLSHNRDEIFSGVDLRTEIRERQQQSIEKLQQEHARLANSRNSFSPTENCAKNNIAMYGESNSKTMPTNSDLLAAMHSMNLSLERLIMNNVGTFIPPVNGRPLTALNERNRNTTEKLRQVDGVPSQEQRGKGRRGGRGKNNRRTPLHYDYGGDSHGSTHAQDYLRERDASVLYRDGGGPSR